MLRRGPPQGEDHDTTLLRRVRGARLQRPIVVQAPVHRSARSLLKRSSGIGAAAGLVTMYVRVCVCVCLWGWVHVTIGVESVCVRVVCACACMVRVVCACACVVRMVRVCVSLCGVHACVCVCVRANMPSLCYCLLRSTLCIASLVLSMDIVRSLLALPDRAQRNLLLLAHGFAWYRSVCVSRFCARSQP